MHVYMRVYMHSICMYIMYIHREMYVHTGYWIILVPIYLRLSARNSWKADHSPLQYFDPINLSLNSLIQHVSRS